MNEPDHAVVRFACPRCLARLVAPAAQAGAKRRCPNCQRVFEVPTAAVAARHHRDPGQYQVAEGMTATAAEGEPHLTVVCPLCRSVMRAREHEVGRQLICPDCGTPSLVVAPAKVEKRDSPLLASLDAYALSDDAEGAMPGTLAESPRYVPMTCPLCRTFLQVPENLVGSQITCPDCREPMTVPHRAEPGKGKDRDLEGLGEYALHVDGNDSPAPTTDSYRTLCPLCQALIYLEPGQAGRRVVCPDCRTSFVAPRPPEVKRRRDLAAEAGELYGVGEAIEVLEQEPADVTPRWRIGLPKSSADRERPADPPPRWTFFSGIFGFPAYRNSWQKWLGLSCGLVLPLWLGSTAWTLAAVASAVSWFMAMILGGFAVVLGAIWTFIAFSSMLSILRGTAYGHHRIEDWPEDLFVDWMGEIMFLVNAAALSVLPGVLVAGALQATGETRGLCIAIGLIVLFPVSLLALLETNSPLNPFSLPVWRSLVGWWWAWAAFYLETTLLVAMGGGLALLAATRVPFGGIVLAAPLLVATLMIYFRLLGRLVWRCGEVATPNRQAGLQDEDDEA